jgi:hypothetical protein
VCLWFLLILYPFSLSLLYIDRIICLLCVYICHYIFPFIIWTFFFFFLPNVTIKRKYNDKYRHTRDRLFGLCYILPIYSSDAMLNVVLLLSESRAIINDVDVILHGFMLHIIYTTVFTEFKRLNSENSCINITNYRLC